MKDKISMPTMQAVLVCPKKHQYQLSKADKGMICNKCGSRLRRKWVIVN